MWTSWDDSFLMNENTGIKNKRKQILQDILRLMSTRITYNRAATWQNNQNDMCIQQRLGSAWISHSLIRVFALHSVGSYTSLLHAASKDWCPVRSECLLDVHAILLVLSYRGSTVVHFKSFDNSQASQDRLRMRVASYKDLKTTW